MSCPEAEERRVHKRTALLKRLGLLGDDTKGAVIRRAMSLAELVEAYRVVHDTFVEQGYMQPDPTGIRVRPWEAIPETATHIAVKDGRVVGVMSGVIDSPLGVPSDHAFPKEIDDLRSQGRKPLEGTNWLVTKAFRGSSLLGEQLRAGTAHALVKGCTDILGSVSPRHAGLYESIGYEVIGSERSYSDKFIDPVVLVRLDLSALEESCARGDHEFLMSYWVKDNPYISIVPDWIAQAEAAFRDPQLLRELFVEQGCLLPRCSSEELEKIRRAWGDVLFQAVLGSHDNTRAKLLAG